MIGQFTVVIATAAFSAFSVHAASCMGDMCTDEELRHDVLDFLTTRYCGSFGGRRVLTSEIRFDGNTNRLACVLSEFALTNDEWIATRSVRQLVKYGSSAQLPFLYSCATNPTLGKIAVEAVLRIGSFWGHTRRRKNGIIYGNRKAQKKGNEKWQRRRRSSTTISF